MSSNNSLETFESWLEDRSLSHNIEINLKNGLQLNESALDCEALWRDLVELKWGMDYYIDCLNHISACLERKKEMITLRIELKNFQNQLIHLSEKH